SGGDNSVPKNEVKVRFAREFTDVGSIAYSAPESLSSASSFQSLSSTLSTKSNSGIYADFTPQSPSQVSNDSYVNSNISGLEDLIAGCAEIHLNSDDDHSYRTLQNSQDFSQDQTFASATDQPADISKNLSNDISLTNSQNAVDDNSTTRESMSAPINFTKVIDDEATFGTICIKEPAAIIESNRRNSFIQLETIQRSVTPNKSDDLSSGDHQMNNNPVDDTEKIPLSCNIEISNFNSTACLSPNKEVTNVSRKEEPRLIENTPVDESSLPCNIEECNLNLTVCLSPNKEIINVPKEIENNVIDDIDEIPVSRSIVESNLNSMLCLLPNKEVTNVPKKEESRPIENNVIDDIDEIPVSRSIEESNLNSTMCLSSNKIVTNTPKKEESRSIENNVIDDIDEIPVSCSIEESNLNLTMCLSPNKEVTNMSQKEESRSIENNFINDIDEIPVSRSIVEFNLNSTVCLPPNREDTNVLEEEEFRSIENNFIDYIDRIPVSRNSEDSSLNSTMCLSSNQEITHVPKEGESSSIENNFNDIDKIPVSYNPEDSSLNSTMCFSPNEESIHVSKEEEPSPIENNLAEIAKEELDTLNIEQPNFEELQSAAEEFANDVYKSSLQFSGENEPFINATSEIFQDPTSFDFLIKHGNSKTDNRLRAESLYVKFDPLVADTSMSTQGNIQFMKEEQNDKNESITNSDTPKHNSTNFNTPKCNPAIAAIDRLLFYSPISTNITPKINELQKKETSKNQSAKESESDTPLIIDVNMNKELELVRSTVLQLEEKLEKQKKEHEAEIENQRNAFQEKINKLQTQIVQEIKSKSQMTVVVEEYEKSISRMLTERERNRAHFEQEKAKLQEELQATNVHLSNTEAAFNDVHQKYERLKGFVSVYKSNETLLKESIRENLETIKGLEMRYDQLKNHAKTELEKANYELDAIRKQHEDETTKLHALVRRAELKSNSLAELVDQKTKENKELTQILDEVIARVGHQSAE
ncbi:unnamed protein product, partial [Heterotrigona itama]